MLSLTSTALAAGLKDGGLLCSLNPLCSLLLRMRLLPFINSAESGCGSNGQHTKWTRCCLFVKLYFPDFCYDQGEKTCRVQFENFGFFYPETLMTWKRFSMCIQWIEPLGCLPLGGGAGRANPIFMKGRKFLYM
jgi:hypothetical protein